MYVFKMLFENRRNKRLSLLLIFFYILCFSLLPAYSVSAQLCPERWEASVEDIKESYKPGETITFTVNYLTRNPSDCPSCRQQILVGLFDASGTVIHVSCIYDGSPMTCPKETTGKGNISWKGPSSPGTYQIIAANDYQNSCEDAKANFRVKSSNRNLATIQVSSSTEASSSQLSTTDLPWPNPISQFQNWLKQVQSPTVTETNKSSTTPAMPTSPETKQTLDIQSWFQQNQKMVFSLISIAVIVVIGLRYLFNRKRGKTDKVISILFVAIAGVFLLWVYVIIPVFNFIRQHWQAILISLIALLAIGITAWRKGYIRFGLDRNDSTDIVDAISPPITTIEKGVIFESQCLKLLEKMGFICETTKTTGDGGIDIRAHSSQPFTSGLYIIQCKNWESRPVGAPVVRDLYGIVHSERANKGILITTSQFTADALKWAQGKNLELIDGEKLNQIIDQID